MATTWAASAPDKDAINEVGKAGLGSGYGLAPSSAFQTIKWPGNKRAVLTKLTATGTYTTGGDAFTPSTVGLAEIHAAFMVCSATANVLPSIDATASSGTPAFDCVTSTTAPKIKYYDDGVQTAAGGTLTGDAFHVILVGI